MNARKFIHTIPIKLYLILLGLILFSFFSNDFGLVDIQKTAVILAAAVDKSEEGFSVTTQIAVPKGSDRSTGGTSSVEIQAEGATVSDCITHIFSKTGWVPKLVFCNLILLGEEAAQEDVVSALNYFLRNEYMNDSCHLAVCEGKAHDIISSKSAIDDTSSFAIGKLFSDAAEKSGRVLPISLKKFAVDYYGVSKSSYMPLVRANSHGNQPQEQSSSSGSDANLDDSGEDEKIYIADQTAIFSEGKMVAVLSPDQTLALSMLKGNIETGTFTAKDGEKLVTLSIRENDGKISLDMKNAPKVTLALDVMVRLCCRGTTAPVEDISEDKVSPKVVENAKKYLTELVTQIWEIAKESDCDLFDLKQKLYQTSAKKYEEWKDYLLSTVTPDFQMEVTSLQ